VAEIVYILCAIFSLICAGLLFRSYKTTSSHLLFWSALCFGFLALNNIILFVDLVMLPNVEFNGSLYRNICGATAGSLLLFGLIWELG
jgi:hypothetical protein